MDHEASRGTKEAAESIDDNDGDVRTAAAEGRSLSISSGPSVATNLEIATVNSESTDATVGARRP